MPRSIKLLSRLRQIFELSVEPCSKPRTCLAPVLSSPTAVTKSLSARPTPSMKMTTKSSFPKLRFLNNSSCSAICLMPRLLIVWRPMPRPLRMVSRVFETFLVESPARSFVPACSFRKDGSVSASYICKLISEPFFPAVLTLGLSMVTFCSSKFANPDWLPHRLAVRP